MGADTFGGGIASERRLRKDGCHASLIFLWFCKNSVTERVSEVGVFVTILIFVYNDLMKWAQKCEEAPRCFLVSFDMIFTRICEMQLWAAVFSQT